MRSTIRVACAMAMLAADVHLASAADSPSEIIVGTWKHQHDLTNPIPNDSTFEFAEDGTGEVSKAEKGQRIGAKITWKITKSFGNACILVIDYVGTPEEVKPLTLLVAFEAVATRSSFRRRTVESDSSIGRNDSAAKKTCEPTQSERVAEPHARPRTGNIRRCHYQEVFLDLFLMGRFRERQA